MNAFLAGELCWLRPLTRDDASTIADWSHDREVTRHLVRGTFPTYPEQAIAAYDAMVEQPTEIELAIMSTTISPEKMIGVTGLHSLNWIARSAEFRVLIGDKLSWGQGVGTEVVQLMVAYGFELLNLHKVWLGVSDSNVAARRSYEKAGFVFEGTLRDEVFRNGRYHDVSRMSMLLEEYRKAKPTWSIAPHLERQFPRS